MESCPITDYPRDGRDAVYAHMVEEMDRIHAIVDILSLVCLPAFFFTFSRFHVFIFFINPDGGVRHEWGWKRTRLLCRPNVP